MPSADRPPEPVVRDPNSGVDPGGEQTNQRFPVVAVGASAGGLEAFRELLRHLPFDTGMAFVFVQHLPPKHESMLVQLLARETPMPVKQAVDGTDLSPNQVYVIPPNAIMTLMGFALAIKPREGATTIDPLLRSLAASHGSGAIAVILSGTGSDGALGVQSIAEEGGIVFAQDPGSAKFDGMPRSAIATGCVDFVLTPGGIAAELARIAREPHFLNYQSPEPASSSDAEMRIQDILDMLRDGTGIDFGLYRQTTVRRRMVRRIALLRQKSLADYLQYVRNNPDELQALAQDILIRVTSFFRNPEVYEVLSRRVFPALIRRTPVDSAVRIWVPGCSTGEEAYSIAICYQEVAEQIQSRVPLQLFGTDLNESAIEKARRGSYVENIAADVTPERLARFFVRVGKELQVSRRLRDACVFSRHDLLNNPPFSRMSLISCRNVLIYIEALQKQAFTKFHFALNPGGFLLLGKSETAAASPELFAPLDKEAKLYVRQEAARNLAPVYAIAKRAVGLTRPIHEAPAVELGPARSADLRRQADRVVLNRYGPPRVIVNADLETITDSGKAPALLAAVSDTQKQRIIELLEKNQANVLKKAIRTAARMGHVVRVEKVKVRDGEGIREVSAEITPLGPEMQHFVIVFEEWGGKPEADSGGATSLTPEKEGKFDGRIGRLAKELASTRAHLESVIVEQESAHEEVVASNEELQSLNEELESSKEELEASNEELTTVNQELQVRNSELDNAREFAQTTLDTVRGALVVLGPDLRVLKANTSFYRTFRLTPGECEHCLIYELGNGHWSLPRLRLLLEDVLPKNQRMEDFEMDYESPATGRRILVLNAHRFEREERILLAMEDVTESRRAEEELRQVRKMEAIGQLAAGVAHDFNNLLTGIVGNASLLRDALKADDPSRRKAEAVLGAAQSAAGLTRQLLAYAGKGRFFMERVDLSDLVVQTSKLIHLSIPANVQLRLDLDSDLALLMADLGQLQQLVMNLVINGAEAIGEAGGVVLVRTGRQTVTEEPLPDLCLSEKQTPGEYVFLEVQDNGSGMDEQTKQRMFDPFFTTKFTGRGLGLASVAGIMRYHKGLIQVHSVPGRGSCFRVLFPITGDVPLPPIEQALDRAELGGSGTVLVIDDEEVIQSFTRSALEPYGYEVLQALDGAEGIELMQKRSSDIGLVLLDVAMPGMTGLETLDRIREIRPDVPVLVCSGFGDSDVEERFAGKDVAGFLPKPYTVTQIARKVKECIRP